MAGIHLAIDGVGAKYEGTAEVLVATVKAALRSSDVGRVTVFSSPRDRRLFDLPVAPHLNVVEKAREDAVQASRWYWLGHGLEAAVRQAGADAVVCLGNGGVVREVPSVLLIQQSLPFCEEALQREPLGMRLRVAAMRRAMSDAAKTGAVVVVQTQVMASWTMEAFGLDPAAVEVVPPDPPWLPPPAREAAALAPMRDVPEGCRVLYVGSDRRYKNVSRLVGAVRRMREAGAPTKLFMTFGRPGEEFQGGAARTLGYLKREEVAAAIELADVVALPSLVETVGLPLLEAMGVGRPVAASDRPYAHAVCGEAAVYFDPTDESSIADVLGKLLADGDLRARLVEAGRGRVAALAGGRPYDRIVATAVRAALAPAGREEWSAAAGSVRAT